MPSRFCPGSRTVIHTLTFSIFVLGLLILAMASADAQWRVAPSISAGIEYDDNPSLFVDSTIGSEVFGYAIGADARISYSSQLTEFAVTPSYLARRYDGFSELDTDDWFVDLDYLYSGQLSSFRLRGAFGDESVRAAERSDVDFSVEDPADIPDDDSARVLGLDQRRRIQIAPDWSYRTGQRSSIHLGARYLDLTYDDNSGIFLSDFSDYRALASFEYDLSPKSSIAISGYYRENEFERTNSDFSGYGLTLDLTRSLSENARFFLSAGLDSTEDRSGNEDTNPIGEISYTRWLQTSRILAAYRRTVSGSGAGVMSVRDTISLSVSRDISDKFSASGGLHAYQTRALDKSVVNFDERDYIQIRVLLTYHFSQVFSVDLDYRYTDIERDISMSAANSNLVNLWFRYRQNK